jgi:hypothetical protein
MTDVSLATVATTFRPLDDLFGEISRHYSQWFEFKHSAEAWRDASEPGSGLPYLLHGPAGFTFSFGPRVLSIYHMTRFHFFCTQPATRHLLRRFTRRVLGLVSGERAIYSPDQGIGDRIYDLVFDGLPFDEIEAHLLRLGAPASSFAELDARCAPDPIYYVDRFQDFQVEMTSVAQVPR